MGDVINEKYNALLEEIKKLNSVAVAFSGGVDSTLLLKIARDALGKNAVAMTIKSEFVPENEIEECKALAKLIGARHIIIPFDALSYDEIKQNLKDRCYHCKHSIFEKLLEKAESREICAIIEGSNVDDLSDYRPGFKAVEELNIISPFLKVKLTKQEVRQMAKMLQIPNWNKPATACLASRIPYGDAITKDALKKIASAENILSSLGFIGARLRVHRNVARIEIDPNDFQKFFSNRERILYGLKPLNFRYITLDLEGYRRGSMN